MARKMMINLSSNVDMNNLQNGDILVYDATKKEFNLINEAVLFRKYDDKIEKIEKEFQKNQQENREFTLKIQESNKKLIKMVENFIKGD